MDEQSGESKEEEVMGESKWRNWYQNKVDENAKASVQLILTNHKPDKNSCIYHTVNHKLYKHD